jgi:uncharacterized protein YggE
MVVCTAILLGQVAVNAAEPTSYVSVTGTGEVAAKPDVVEILGIAQGKGELAGDALTEFRDVVAQAVETLESLEIDGLTVSSKGFSIGPSVVDSRSRLILQPGQTADPPTMTLSEPFRIRIAGVDKIDREQLLDTIVKVIDAAQETGLQMGKALSELDRYRSGPQPGYLVFRLSDTSPFRQQALEKAVQDARARATRLAELADVTLGAVYSIEETSYTTYVPSSMRDAEPNTSPAFEQIQVSVNVRVRYRVAK